MTENITPFVEPADCSNKEFCANRGACILASLIYHEAKSIGDREAIGQAFLKLIDPEKTPCSHEQAVKAREEYSD